MFIKVYNTKEQRIEYIAATRITKFVINEINEGYDLEAYISRSSDILQGYDRFLIKRFSTMEQAVIPKQFLALVNDKFHAKLTCEEYANERFLKSNLLY